MVSVYIVLVWVFIIIGLDFIGVFFYLFEGYVKVVFVRFLVEI